jgi:Electron transfer DM13
MKVRKPSSIVAKVAAGLAVIAVVVVGIWVSGGLITNDFELAMVLTAIWMGIAAAACLAIGWRRPGLRVPVIGAYLLTAIVVGGYLGRSMFIDDEVNERVVRVTPPAPEGANDGRAAERPRNVLLRRGRFEPVAHPAKGTATTIRTASGERVLTLTNFEVDNGPDLRVYLVAGPARDESEVDDFEDLGGLKGNKGNQQYELPRELDLDRYTTVVVWCRAFSVNFARAPLT